MRAEMIDFASAAAIVAAVPALGVERVDLAAAAGRTLAERIVAPADLVPFARSAMDGFAVRAADVRDVPALLPMGAEVFAEAGRVRHEPGTATAIATGGAIPDGADAVIPIEDVLVSSGAIVVAGRIDAGHHVFPPGEDARAGDELAAVGTTLRPADLGLLAAAGITSVAVYRLPRVALLSTGNELVPFTAMPAHGQIRDSNVVTIAAELRRFGIAELRVATVSDDRGAVRAALDEALESADLVVTIGGASVGERDFIKGACEALGVAFAFRAVGLRPARPTAFGRRGATAVAVLPGNPASAFVAVHEFVRPAVAALGGRVERMARIPARLAGSLHARKGRAYAAYCRVRFVDGAYVATPLVNQCSALTRLAADADGLVIVPADGRDLHDGDDAIVDVISWDRVHSAVAETART
jgi:molybdopterin molybdotransferase